MGFPLKGLAPETIWRCFAEISAIPRASKDEGRIADFVENRARELGLEVLRDALHNVLVRMPATEGRESAPIVVCQAHLDMVCEKNEGTTHDFARDPISLCRKGEWIAAEGTTLGADNGIGVAAMLAVMETKTVEHGPLELLFTADEETGMSGAIGLDPELVRGRVLLNLDSEQEGCYTIGCAGGQDLRFEIDVENQDVPSGWKAMALRVRGLLGGHSGCEIHKRRANALRLLGRLLDGLASSGPMALFSLEGGSKPNAIPREAEAVLVLPLASLKEARSIVERLERSFHGEYAGHEPELRVELEELSAVPDRAFSEEGSRRIVRLLLACPHGVSSMSSSLNGLVETSTNLARIRSLPGQGVTVVTSQRSSIESSLDEIVARVRACAELAGARVVAGGRYPAWTPNPQSPLLDRAVAVHEACFGKPPMVSAIHAGLECGMFARKWAGMDMLSFGPTITGPHSPDERVHVPSVARFWDLFRALLAELSA